VANSLIPDAVNVAGPNPLSALSATSVEEKRQDGAPGNDDPFGFQCEPGVLNGCPDGAEEKRSAASDALENTDTISSNTALIEEKRQDGGPGNTDPFGFQCEPGVQNGCPNEAGPVDIPNRFVLVLISGLVMIGGWLYDH
jgi:hypothetical protein